MAGRRRDQERYRGAGRASPGSDVDVLILGSEESWRDGHRRGGSLSRSSTNGHSWLYVLVGLVVGVLLCLLLYHFKDDITNSGGSTVASESINYKTPFNFLLTRRKNVEGDTVKGRKPPPVQLKTTQSKATKAAQTQISPQQEKKWADSLTAFMVSKIPTTAPTATPLVWPTTTASSQPPTTSGRPAVRAPFSSALTTPAPTTPAPTKTNDSGTTTISAEVQKLLPSPPPGVDVSGDVSQLFEQVGTLGIVLALSQKAIWDRPDWFMAYFPPL
ncbi:putative transmembrane protein [Gregarina niphandrodes]|uniref:Transmembrane protein n=1 Tax=Gregarina niphandrodes TaxID=110365 RepID=A0A023B222_GRENI|nr:putative transmembrane protein [Gregarina niphandrodes]EZG50491.1 putative transmembrane protein [Gregarina niphandrodes]|eukprot:XP_011132013.1 putative transmembrane protein [Gregarina niphandrodes]